MPVQFAAKFGELLRLGCDWGPATDSIISLLDWGDGY